MGEIFGRDWSLLAGSVEYTELDMRAACRWPSGEVSLTVYHPAPGIVSAVDLGQYIEVRAGYQTTGIIGSGTAVADSVEYDTASHDRPLTVQITPARVPGRVLLSASWPETDSATVLAYVAESAGLLLEDQSGQVVQYRAGYHLSGGLLGTVGEIAEDLGARYQIDGQTLRLWPRDGVYQRTARVWAADTGLMYASAAGRAIRATARLSPHLRPGQVVRLVSEAYDGDIRVTECTHEIDTAGTAWVTSVVGVPYG